jgi:hypothetical protein
MKNILNNDEKGEVFSEENFKVQTKIQNYSNSNREASNEFVKNSYYQEVGSKMVDSKTTIFNKGENADARNHNIIEVDTVVEADKKDNSRVNNLF